MSRKSSRIGELARKVRDNPGDSFTKFTLALECLKQERNKQARVLFEDIRERDPEYVGVYYHLGALYRQLDQPSEARRCYEEGMDVAREQNRNRTLSELREALEELKIEQQNRKS